MTRKTNKKPKLRRIQTTTTQIDLMTLRPFERLAEHAAEPKKDMIRKTNQEKDQRLVFLQQQNEDLMQRLSVVERKTHSSDIARVDSALDNEQARMQYALTKIKQATEAGDGDAMIKAQDMLYEARKRVEAIQTLKKRMTDTATQQNNPINPKVQAHAKEWMSRNSWYDPAKE
jgi:hypothetical protein